ncbi:MerR family transcriptional regulator [Amycolatopsis saalfeldensis]|uniref:MerR HTH family regulatory protein n=1 Tax=Amycolatopsis saalfeldensis TaxID=394193 RepID=A0A1H8YPH8_9PSEU|nr:MerR family transcriptional regulator [Amycolatopsis saalfeldensis]SEP53942.1 MerR HTH family regulatory protein [Amycolatopsis saalfeldensis]
MAVPLTSPPGQWNSAQVAEMLGVPQVTLRTWDNRYGIGASHRDSGDRRRYSAADLDRLRRMRGLLAQGYPAREAASAALAGSAANVTPDARIASIGSAADRLSSGALAGLLDDSLATLGAARTWSSVVAPVLRDLGGRWNDGEDCMAAEWTLSAAASAALDRHLPIVDEVSLRAPVVLACSPAERHELPVKMLYAALRETGVPAVYLGGMVPGQVVSEVVRQFAPSLVLLWSMTSSTADLPLLRALRETGLGVCPAGPGWVPAATGPDEIAETFDDALRVASAAAEARDRPRPAAQRPRKRRPSPVSRRR